MFNAPSWKGKILSVDNRSAEHHSSVAKNKIKYKLPILKEDSLLLKLPVFMSE